MAKLWAGRTSGETNAAADDFNSSIRFDSRMYRQDITGSMAHASMLGHQGIITMEEAEALIAGLRDILADLDSGALDNAIKVLNQLTEGNRLVGIISHVDKLEESIPQKIRVKKTAKGSELAVEV